MRFPHSLILLPQNYSGSRAVKRSREVFHTFLEYFFTTPIPAHVRRCPTEPYQHSDIGIDQSPCNNTTSFSTLKDGEKGAGSDRSDVRLKKGGEGT